MFARISVATTLACALLLAGCSSYRNNAQKLRTSWQRANFQEAEEIAKKAEASAGDDDKLVWQLDFATTLRANGNIEESQKVFDAAADTVVQWDSKADVLLSKEIAASITNLNALPYRGRGMDRIMLHTYRALNYLESSQTDEARPALNAAFHAQSDALANNAKEIEAAQQAAQENSVNVSELESNPDIAQALENERANSEANDIAVYTDYVNPFTTWLHGVYFLRTGVSDSDFERAKKSLQRVSQMIPQNSFVKEDLAECTSDNLGTKADETTYVIFEYGVAPNLGRSEINLLLPIPAGAGRITIVPVAISLPKLTGFQQGGIPLMTANGVPAQTICDMRSVVKTDFENSYPSILRRTLITAFVKSTASAAANIAATNYARRSGSAGAAVVAIGTMIGTSAYTLATSEADTRIWQTLPANYSIVKLKTPASREIDVSVAGRTVSVHVPEGQTTAVFVKSVNIEQVPSAKTFSFKN